MRLSDAGTLSDHNARAHLEKMVYTYLDGQHQHIPHWCEREVQALDK